MTKTNGFTKTETELPKAHDRTIEQAFLTVRRSIPFLWKFIRASAGARLHGDTHQRVFSAAIALNWQVWLSDLIGSAGRVVSL
ncbi:MAG: hypothetical protein Q8922_08790 [Bacteroidota bacterium]|nr:hypothetical protein [Bacteroidota bacterium]MDP4234401.1 hypothetical protein [Bacteroidota bacterium]MDP4288019.1 hypothetical protein [Bacteroidota bacterium]